jgi:hypothetical protein
MMATERNAIDDEPEESEGTPDGRRLHGPIKTLYPGVKKVRRPLGLGHGSVFYQPAREERRGDRVVRWPARWRAV